ncbi:MAG: hypothetical protein R3Y57_02425 [Erysipelotrichaceae bacterium]
MLKKEKINLNVSVADYPSNSSIIGIAKLMSLETKEGFVFDFGHTNIKRGVVNNECNETKIHILTPIKSCHTDWHIDDSYKLDRYLLDLVVSTVNENRTSSTDINIYISIANYVENGQLIRRGGFGKLASIHPNYQIYLEEVLSRMLLKKVNIKLFHDTTSATFAMPSMNGNAAVISLGTSLGIGFIQAQIQERIYDRTYSVVD